MTIHAFPTPSLRALLNAFFFKNAIVSHQSAQGNNRYLFSRGTWALAAAIEHVRLKRQGRKIKIWLPDYFCADALAAFESQNVTCYFYPVNKKLSPDWPSLEQTAMAAPPDVFVLVHYFGFTNSLIKAEHFCRQYRCELIEDACHVARLSKEEHLTIYSPRKLFAVPEGGQLLSHEPINESIIRHGSITGFRVVCRWIFKRLCQRVMVTLGIDWHSVAGFAVRRRTAKAINSVNETRRAGTYTQKMLANEVAGMETVIKQRRENYERLAQILRNKKTVKTFFDFLPDDVCPYVLPIMVFYDRTQLQNKFHALGIPAAAWPILPLAVSENRVEHADALWLNEHILLLPIHQDLKPHQMDYLIRCLSQYVG